MDELDNDALPLLLILDDELFPQLLEWSASKGWSDLVIFLLETDYFRFKTNAIFEEAEYSRPSLFEAYYLIQKNAGGCFDSFFSPEKMVALKRLLDSGIPLNSVYSQVCNHIWKELLARGNDIVDSAFWPSVRRSILENHEISIEDMLGDVTKRKYFDRYIQGEPSDLAALQCLLSVRRILKALSRYKPNADSKSNPATPQAGAAKPAPSKTSDFFSFFTGGSGEEGGSSLMRRWKASKSSVSSASKALQAPFAPSTPSSHSAGASQHQSQTIFDYTDPFEAFKIVLEGTRQVQKQFFPSGTSIASTGTSAFTTYTTVSNTTNGFLYGGHNARGTAGYDSTSDAGSSSNAGSPRARSNSNGSPTHRQRGSRGAHTTSGASAGLLHSTSQRNCSGISESLRIEIQSTLTVNASVRAREIETVDRAFAFACAHMLEKLLLALEQEMLDYVKDIFEEFVETNDYALMVAHARAMQCTRIVDYTSKLEFLYDRVRQQRIVSWKDAQTRGKVFLAYEQLNAEGEEIGAFSAPNSPARPAPFPAQSAYLSGATRDKQGASSQPPGPAQTSNENDFQTGFESARFRPNVVAISLEIVLPHTTLLSPATVTACPHRLSLYAGGRRRAARLRRKVELKSVKSYIAPAPGGGSPDTLTYSKKSIASDAAPTAEAVSPLPTLPLPLPPTSAQTSAISPTNKSPMRRMSSVKFHLGDIMPPQKDSGVAVPPPAEPIVTETQAPSEQPVAPLPEKKSEEAGFGSDSDHDGEDTLSDLPALGIAGSIKVRNITSIGDVGKGGNDVFNDIVNANSSFARRGGGRAEEEEEEVEEESSGSTSDGSDSSSDYEGDVRHVESGNDLDLLIRTGSSFLEDDSPLITPRDGNTSPLGTPRGGGSRSRRGSSARLYSRTASNASVNTIATGTTALTRQTSGVGGNMGYDDRSRRMVAIDLDKLDRTLHRQVLGASQALPEPPAKHGKRILSRNLVAAMAVALTGVKDDDEQFSRKFLTTVEESFAFTTDTKGLGQLNDILFSKEPTWVGSNNIAGYLKSFETAASVYRQNSMLDTARPLYRVCVQLQSTVIPAAEASRLKAEFAVMHAESRPAGTAAKAPLHTPRTHHPIAGRIAHSHVKIGLSFMLLTPSHTMLTALESIAFAARCALANERSNSMLSDGSGDRLESSADGSRSRDDGSLQPLPLKLRYTDYFGEYVQSARDLAAQKKEEEAAVESGRSAKSESLYELYLGTHPDYSSARFPDTPDSSFEQKSACPAAAQAPRLCEPISRHIGVCDFSISEMIATVSVRLMMQILMLTLVDRPIMLISTSSTLLSQVQAAIPRLIWPFRIESTHVVRQILSGAELHHFVYRHDVPFVSETQQPVIREKKLNRKTSSWRDIITRFATNVGSSIKAATGSGGGGGGDSAAGPMMRSPRTSFSRPRKAGSTGDLLAGMIKRGSGTFTQGHAGSVAGSEDGDRKSESHSPANLSIDLPGSSNGSPVPEPRSPYTRIVTPPSLQLPTPTSNFIDGEEGCAPDAVVDQHSCILGVDANAFYTAAPELRDELESMRIRGLGFTFIDIDSGLILNRRPDDFCSEDDCDVPPKPLPSRLSDFELFRTSNFGMFRSLIKSVNRISEDLAYFARGLGGGQDGEGLSGSFDASMDSVQMAAALSRKIVSTNREIEKAFYAFWSEFVLRAIPKCIQHFPGPKVISCDIRAVLTELLHTVVASSASYDMGEDYEDILPAPGSEQDSPSPPSTSGKSLPTSSQKGDISLSRAYHRKQLPPAEVPRTPSFENMTKMPFEEFLALFVEQVASHGETNMCYAFYKEFIADGSVVFKNLLLRHSAVLEKWCI